MAVRIRKQGTVVASFATAQQVDISHANDSVRLGDGTNFLGSSLVGGSYALKVDVVQSVAGGTAPSHTDDAAFTVGSGSVSPIGAMLDDSATDSVNEGDVGVVRMSATRDLHVMMVDGVGDSAMDDANNALRVNVVAGSSGGPSKTDDSAFTVATDTVAPMGAMADETTPDSVDEGDVGVLRMTLDRLLKIQVAGVASGIAVPVTDNSTTLSVDDGAGSLTVDGTVAATQSGTWNVTNVSGTVSLPTGASTLAEQQTQTTALQLLDDAVATTASAIPSKGFAISGTDGTNARVIKTDTSGELQVDVLTLPALAAGTNNIGDVDVLTVPANMSVNVNQIAGNTVSTGNGVVGTGVQRVAIASDNSNVPVASATASNFNAQVVGSVAHDGVDSGNPVKIGGIARTANPTKVAALDRVDATFDTMGRLVVVPHQVRDLVTRGSAVTLTTTTETTILAAAASTYHDLIWLMLTNTSSTAVRVDIRDTTTGTVQFSVALAANGGAVISPPAPITQTTANTNWTAQLSGAVTDVRIIAMAVKNT